MFKSPKNLKRNLMFYSEEEHKNIPKEEFQRVNTLDPIN